MEDTESPLQPRRTTRQCRLSKKAEESAETVFRRRRNKNTISSSSDESDITEKPQILHDNEHVCGEKLFSFQTRKKCETVIQPIVAKTPHAVRNKFKKDIAATILDDSSEADFSDSGSEYVMSGESATEAESTNESSDEEKDTKFKQTFLKSDNINKMRTNNKTSRSYTIKTDDYFSQQSSNKIVTSNHTLDKLETPRLPQDQLQNLLSKVKLNQGHKSPTKKLVENCHNYFDKWMYLLHENINILLYGLGSKKDILNSFHQDCLVKLPTIVVNGFFPSLSIKDVLDGIILNLLELNENPGNVYEACELIEHEFACIPDSHLYLIVHNIDMMRNGKAQSIFARLAAVRNIHLIASIDHINAPLIWDHSKLSKFNFTWWDATTFHSYYEETAFESSMMVQRTGTLALSSLRNVFLSLTSNSKGIYLILVKYQIENGKKQYYQGLAFKDLYSSCREAFLVSSDLALRAQLTEFVDHKMVKYKRSLDGTEHLIIPIPNTVLQQFLSEQPV